MPSEFDSLENSHGSEAEARGGRSRAVAVTVIVALLLVGGVATYLVVDRLETMNAELAEMKRTVEDASERADDATERAEDAEQAARNASTLREQAERAANDAALRAEEAEIRADVAESDADRARREARLAAEQAERIRQEAQAEMNRLEEALGKIAETRRTALGLVMNLDESSLKFDFDKSELRAENREILARIAGTLLTSDNFTITVTGHTDARGTMEYNQGLSERRARAVADYLIESGLKEELFTVQGLGKTEPVDDGQSESAHARNRRVELGIVNTRIKYYTNR